MGELFVILLIVQIIGNVIYFFKWFKMTTREREWDRKNQEEAVMTLVHPILFGPLTLAVRRVEGI